MYCRLIPMSCQDPVKPMNYSRSFCMSSYTPNDKCPVQKGLATRANILGLICSVIEFCLSRSKIMHTPQKWCDLSEIFPGFMQASIKNGPF